MTVQFKPQVSKVNILDDVEPAGSTPTPTLSEYAKLFGNHLNKKPLIPTEAWWITRSYVTHSERQPVQWQPYDHSTYTTKESLNCGFDEWVEYLSKNSSINGYKIITMCLDMHNGKASFEPECCKEYFKPVEKVYINGPKKKPLPKKLSGHY